MKIQEIVRFTINKLNLAITSNLFSNHFIRSRKKILKMRRVIISNTSIIMMLMMGLSQQLCRFQSSCCRRAPIKRGVSSNNLRGERRDKMCSRIQRISFHYQNQNLLLRARGIKDKCQINLQCIEKKENLTNNQATTVKNPTNNLINNLIQLTINHETVPFHLPKELAK